MHSDLIIISWWSNCLGLACLSKVCEFAPTRSVFVIQVGKSETQKELFRHYMPKQVKEIVYPPDSPADHWCVCEFIIRQEFKEHEALWLVDHDLFVLEPFEHWLHTMDNRFQQRGAVLSYPFMENKSSITNPLFWISPKNLPGNLPPFAPMPLPLQSLAHAPSTQTVDCTPVRPVKDTMVLVQEELERMNLTSVFSLETSESRDLEALFFPRHEHLGHLSLFTWTTIPEHLTSWARDMIDRYAHFYDHCLPEWKSIEDPVLLRRLKELRRQFEEQRPTPLR